MMKKLLIPLAFLALLFACTSLSRADETRLVELAQKATQQVLTEAEKVELNALREKAKEGGFDLERALEMLGTAIASIFGANIWRDRKRAMRGEPTGTNPKA